MEPVQRQVHPRSRGEYRERSSHVPAGTGSPPLTRGIHSGRKIFLFAHRFTPAHAGNTLLWRCSYLCRWVHPRSRGEYSFLRLQDMVHGGSPPLTRGIPDVVAAAIPYAGFTPAHAGNTLKKALFYLTFSNTHFHISFNF